MNQKEIKELIEYLIEKNIAEFELQRGDVRVRIKREAQVSAPEMRYVTAQVAAESERGSASPSPNPSSTGSAAGTASIQAAEGQDLQIVKSPIVGTFYESPSPGSPPFVKIGDPVEVGQVLCIIEAMKLMNEIESDYAGKITQKLVSNGQPVEYGQPLFAISVRP